MPTAESKCASGATKWYVYSVVGSVTCAYDPELTQMLSQVDFCKFRRETVGIGMSYLDRYLCTSRGRAALFKRKEYQLAAMTALYVAIKLHEPLEMETSLLADLSRGCYTEMEFVECEQVLLTALKWRMNGPTALQFAQHYLTFLPDTLSESVNEAIFDYTRFQIELAIADQSFVPLKMSDIGLAAVLNGIEGIDTNLLPLKAQSKFIRSIERYCAIIMEDVVIIQAKLSLLLVNMLAGEFGDIIGPVVEAADRSAANEMDLTDEEDNGPEYFVKNGQILRRLNSPVSVLKSHQ